MSGMKMDILWSPNQPDRYITFGTDLNLYEVKSIKEITPKSQGVKISDSTYSSLLPTNTDQQYIKCLSWYPFQNPDNLLAIGLSSGKVVLSAIGKTSTADKHGLTNKELVPKHARHCNCLAWSPEDENLLAQGLDKYRSDCSLLIWDVMSKIDSGMHGSHDQSSIRPCIILGSSESTSSLDWFGQQPKTLVTGMNNKYLRIFDLRDISRPQSVAYTKGVYGVCVDPHFNHRLASYTEGQVYIWDNRNFDRPVLTQGQNKSVLKISWCPTRNGLLAVLPMDSPAVKLYDVQHATVGADEIEPTVMERLITPPGNHCLSSFDWHRSTENRLLTVSPTGTVRDVTVYERIALTWTSDIHLTWACGRQVYDTNSVKLSQEASDDISIKMKRRALKGYGLQKMASSPQTEKQRDRLLEYSHLVSEDPQLQELWRWLSHVKVLVDEGRVRPVTQRGSKFVGVQHIMGLSEGKRSEMEYQPWQDLETNKFRQAKKMFRSEERSKALQLCHWDFEKEFNAIHVKVSLLEAEGDFERAAAIALFNLQFRRALQALTKGAAKKKDDGLNLNMVAVALSGYADDRNALWKETVSDLFEKLANPYLKAMFSFLITENDYEDILDDEELKITDRVALACLYLPDKKLKDFIEDKSISLTDAGNLDGLLLTGITKDGLNLLQHYVDRTSDIQTACIVAIQALPCVDITKDTVMASWLEDYRALLDSWRLWHHRAEFDGYHSKLDASLQPSQISISCNYCGKSVSTGSSGASRGRPFIFGGASTYKQKISSCPTCRKPLPRCALCLMNMGTPSQGILPNTKPKSNTSVNEEPSKLSAANDWFTWCQTCRHGGHAKHITQWFQKHTECAVTGCTCKCMSLDGIGQVNAESTDIVSPAY